MKSINRVEFITHKAKQVLLIDFTNCGPEEVQSVSDEAEQIITAQPQQSVLVLADFSGAQFSRDAVTRLKEVTTCDRPFVKRAAWVHTENLPKVFYDAITRFSQREFPTFKTREQALEFLVED
jgi:hypothetical protein